MLLALILYTINTVLLLFLGVIFFRKYYNLGGVFFLFFSFSTALWFLFYTLSFGFTQDLYYLEIFIKLSYFVSLLSLYSFLLFLIYFEKKKRKIISKVLFLYIGIFLIIGYVYIKTSHIIDGLYFHELQQDWYEQEGKFFPLHLLGTFLFIPAAIFLSWYRLKRLGIIDRKRLQFILGGIVGFIILTIGALLILPLFGIFSMERYVGLFFVPFILSVLYSIRRYDFLNFKITFIHSIIFASSLILSFLLLGVFKIYSNSLFSYDFKNYWGITGELFFIEFVFGVSLFFTIFSILKKYILPHFDQGKFSHMLEQIKTKLPFITNLEGVNQYLKNEFQNQFNIKHVDIFNTLSHYDSTIIRFFDADTSRLYFMNDIVFIEENKNKLSNYSGTFYKNKNAYLIFPLRNIDGKTIGIFEIGKKSLNDPYYTSEIYDLYRFTDVISGHLKYLSVYKKMQDLSINLDKKVDEKTIEYNNLLNKQKEFIAYVGHEIKNPITNTLFLSDSIRQDIIGKVDTDILEDAQILYDELVKVSRLVKYIFSAEKFDLHTAKLYKQKINISKFLQEEVFYFQHNHDDITFIGNIQKGIIADIDEIQFRQVIQNLVNNSIKFADATPVVISFSLNKQGENITIQIQDNGSGLSENEAKNIFEKYATGSGNATGLGMGLYLCKRIIELHGGDISVSSSKELGGACFNIHL